MLKKKLRNYYFWSAFAAFLLLLAQTLGIEVVAEDYNKLVEGLLGLLLMLGFLSKDEPPDDQKKEQ